MEPEQENQGHDLGADSVEAAVEAADGLDEEPSQVVLDADSAEVLDEQQHDGGASVLQEENGAAPEIGDMPGVGGVQDEPLGGTEDSVEASPPSNQLPENEPSSSASGPEQCENPGVEAEQAQPQAEPSIVEPGEAVSEQGAVSSDLHPEAQDSEQGTQLPAADLHEATQEIMAESTEAPLSTEEAPSATQPELDIQPEQEPCGAHAGVDGTASLADAAQAQQSQESAASGSSATHEEPPDANMVVPAADDWPAVQQDMHEPESHEEMELSQPQPSVSPRAHDAQDEHCSLFPPVKGAVSPQHSNSPVFKLAEMAPAYLRLTYPPASHQRSQLGPQAESAKRTEPVAVFGSAPRFINNSVQFISHEASKTLLPEFTPGPGTYVLPDVFEKKGPKEYNGHTAKQAPFRNTEPRFQAQNIQWRVASRRPGPQDYRVATPTKKLSQHVDPSPVRFTTGKRSGTLETPSPGPVYFPAVHPVHPQSSKAAFAKASRAVSEPVSPAGKPGAPPGPGQYSTPSEVLDKTRNRRAAAYGFGTAPRDKAAVASLLPAQASKLFAGREHPDGPAAYNAKVDACTRRRAQPAVGFTQAQRFPDSSSITPGPGSYCV